MTPDTSAFPEVDNSLSNLLNFFSGVAVGAGFAMIMMLVVLKTVGYHPQSDFQVYAAIVSLGMVLSGLYFSDPYPPRNGGVDQ